MVGGLRVRCYTCHGVGVAATGDLLADRAAWPESACFFTPGCAGAVVPEALN